MRRIFIDKRLKDLALEYAKDLFKGRTKLQKPIESLPILKKDLEKEFPKYAKYVEKIINEYNELNSLLPSQVSKKKEEFDKLVPESDLNKLILNNGTQTSFHELVVGKMRYDAVREKDFLPYLREIGIKSCVYCNAQLTIIIEKEENKKIQAKLELDHHYSKSKYPFLCTSFFNLLPCCSNCNKAKLDNEASFHLYTENENDLDAFKFNLDKSSVISYLIKRDLNEIKFKFEELEGNTSIPGSHNKMFCIQEIYDTQKDILEELIHKKEAYTELYKKDLVESFKELFPDKSIISRLIIGNYDKPEDIHKRPMSKFMQDIANDLGLM